MVGGGGPVSGVVTNARVVPLLGRVCIAYMFKRSLSRPLLGLCCVLYTYLLEGEKVSRGGGGGGGRVCTQLPSVRVRCSPCGAAPQLRVFFLFAAHRQVLLTFVWAEATGWAAGPCLFLRLAALPHCP